ncbi:MAG: hypothetical protein ACI33P_13195, partial [Lysinibacillus sp.]
LSPFYVCSLFLKDALNITGVIYRKPSRVLISLLLLAKSVIKALPQKHFATSNRRSRTWRS